MYGALRCCYWYYCWTNFYRNWHRHSISSFVLWLINSISNNKSVSMKWYASSFYDNFPAKKFFNIFCCCCSDHLVMGHPVFFSGVWSILCSICKTQTPEEEKTSPGIVFGFGSVATSLAYTHKLKCKCVQREKTQIERNDWVLCCSEWSIHTPERKNASVRSLFVVGKVCLEFATWFSLSFCVWKFGSVASKRLRNFHWTAKFEINRFSCCGRQSPAPFALKLDPFLVYGSRWSIMHSVI